MKTTSRPSDLPKPTRTPATVLPLQIRKALVGLEMTDYDLSTLKYLKFIFNQISVNSATFLHVVPPINIFNVFDDNNHAERDKFDQEIVKKITRAIKKIFPKDSSTKIKVEVKEGNALEQLLGKAEEWKSDLVVIGQKAGSEHHGILVKNFARQVWSNALIIPENAKPKLNKILVPIDFSNHSAEALRMALAINKQLKKPAEITLLYIYDMPANFAAYRFNKEKVMKLIREDREQAIQQLIVEQVPADDLQHIEWDLLEHNHFAIGEHIVKFAEKNKHNLIVMGAKGHSKLALLLLGSVTEKALSLTQNVPVFIVK
jgi:nucleotide-binding universal stress UspA family protein